MAAGTGNGWGRVNAKAVLVDAAQSVGRVHQRGC